MNYHNITHEDMLNGPGLRTVLWVSGCNHYCVSCQNQITWDPNSGVPFDLSARDELFGYLDKEYCDGLTLSGGDPLYPGNREDILDLLRKFRKRYGGFKTVWLYTGYTMNGLALDGLNANSLIPKILELIDILVDGPYRELEKSPNRYWVGSDNQEIWMRDRKSGTWTKMPKEYQKSLSEEQHQKEMGCDC